MAPKTSRASKVKGWAPFCAKAERSSAAKKVALTAAAKAKAKTIPKPPKVPKLAKLKQVPGGPKPLNTRKQIQEQILKNRIKHKAEREKEDVDELPIKYADPTLNESDFVMGSEAVMTWGDAATEGGRAPKRARVGRGLADAKRKLASGVRFAKKKVKHVGALAPAFALDESDIDSSSDDENDAEIEKILAGKEEQKRMKNSGGHSLFLKLPREVRELIYGYLLVKDRPIEVHGNWSATYPLSGPVFAHAILGVNRAINREASKFLAMTNTFHALVRRAMPDWKHNNKIDERYIANFRNIVVEIMDKNVSASPEEHLTCQTLQRLKKADSAIHSLVLMLEPYRIQNSPAQALLQAVPPNATAVAYADWFKQGNEIHRLLACHRGLRCRELFVVAKLKADGLGGQERRVVIYIDARRLPQNFERGKVMAENKQRLIKSATTAREEVEQVAHDLEWLTLLTSTRLSLDDIRATIATYEADRTKELGEDVDDVLPRLRLMEMDEEIADLKWWSREVKAIKQAAKHKAMKDLAKEMTSFCVGHVEEMVGLAAPVILSHWLEDQSQQIEDIQLPADDASSNATAAAPPSSSNLNVVKPSTGSASAAIAASAPAPYTFTPQKYEPPAITTMRERKESLAFRATNCELPCAPDTSAPVPSVAQAQQRTLSGVFGDLANPTAEQAVLPSEVEKGKNGQLSSMEAGGDWVPKGFYAVDLNAGEAVAGPFSSMHNGGYAIFKGFDLAIDANAASTHGSHALVGAASASSMGAPAAASIIDDDSLFFTEKDDAEMIQNKVNKKAAAVTAAMTSARDEEGLFFTEEDDAEMAQSVQLKEVRAGEEAAAVPVVGRMDAETSASGRALYEVADGSDGGV